MAADTDSVKQWSIREDGCLSVDVNTHHILYNHSLNSLVLTGKDHTITVLDALSGAFLQKSDLSGHKKFELECAYLPEKDKTVYCDGSAVGVRGDLQGILLLDTALQTAVAKTEDTVKVELPLAEATQLLKTLLSTDLSNKDYVDDFAKLLSDGIEKAQDATQGNHKTAKWATVVLVMQHMAIRSVCSSLMEELTKSNQTGQGFPVASAIVDRLGFLLPSSRADISKEPVNRALMYSEAARRETFANWPHMNYKWALPEPMAQAGFFHTSNRHGDDRAMCFTCNVCLVCWEPTDEPWSEHERHSQLCPYIKGDYTQNVPLTVTYATQPAQFHDDNEQQRISCLSRTFNEDFIATSTRSGSIVVWDIGHILQKHCQFDIDLGSALITMKTGLHIERSYSENIPVTPNHESGHCDTAESIGQQRTSLDHQSRRRADRPLHDLHVTSLCIADKTKWQDEMDSPNLSKPTSSGNACLSLICGVSLRCAKPVGQQTNFGIKTDNNQSVQLMNEVNDCVSADSPSISQLIDNTFSDSSTFSTLPGQLAPYILVLSLVEESQSLCEASPVKKKSPSSPVKAMSSKDGDVPYNKHSNDMDYWSVDPWEDPDCQIVGITLPPAGKDSEATYLKVMGNKLMQELEKDDDVMNNLSDPCDSVDAMPEPSSPDKRLSFSDLLVKNSTSLPSFHNSIGSSSSSANGASITSDPPLKVPVKISGVVIQCLELPFTFHSEQIEVTSITPSLDKQHVIVVLSTKVGFLESSSSPTDAPSSSSINSSSQSYCGGGILVYRLKSENNRLILETKPSMVYQVTSPKDVVTSTFLLPLEIEDQVEERESYLQVVDNQDSARGHIVVTTASGALQIYSLAKLSCLASLEPEQSEKYICGTYCSGIERFAACTDNGKLKFFDLEYISGRKSSMTNSALGDGSMLNGEASACKKAKIEQDALDNPAAEYLTNQRPLTPEVLEQLHDLIQFENLMPRFTAVVPPCWSEIQQEQQQRRHPQHLQQQGEAMQHTRTWKLTTDSGGQTWDEHLFEILLPKPCSVGHVDVKFSLHPMCTLQPNIEVTLLKQNIGSIFCPSNNDNGSREGKKISSEQSTTDGATANCDNLLDLEEMKNTVLDPKFLETHNAEILCGPIKLANCLDLTGSSGLITFSSPQLLNFKPRSLLLHIKGFDNSPVSDPIFITKEKVLETDKSSSIEKVMKSKKKTLGAMYKNMVVDHLKHKNIQGLFVSLKKAGDKSAASERQKLADVKGCDWFQELSVTVRVFKKTNFRAEKHQRHLMIVDTAFHQALIELLNPSVHCVATQGVSPEHLHCMVLDIIIWALAVQMSDVEKRFERPMLKAIQDHLEAMVKTCLILGSRTTAHKFSRLMAMCMESSKYLTDRDAAPAFSYALMQALLASFPHLPQCSSSGAMRWFFILLNRAKCMDVETVALKCCELLMQVSEKYDQRSHHLQALLKTRYGLYGNPFEADLFDMEHSSATKPQAALAGTMPGTSFSNWLKVGQAAMSNSSSTAGNKEQTDLFDLLLSEKNLRTQPDCLRTDILGLLEVEPLHFRCHATSDGTRMERMDSSSNGQPGSSTTSTFPLFLSQHAPVDPLGMDDIMLADDVANYIPQSAVSKFTASPLGHVYNQGQLVPTKVSNLKKESNLPSIMMYGGPKPGADNLSATSSSDMGAPQKVHAKQSKSAASKAFAFPQIQGLLQTPPPQVLVIERMHSGARRFVTLDFGKRIVLTDVIIPSSIDLASLSIDVWVEGEEIDGQRLIVASDIGHRTLVMNNIIPAPVCRYLKITTVGRYSGGTTRSRIPLGSFYGHTYILPWESRTASGRSQQNISPTKGHTGSKQSKEQAGEASTIQGVPSEVATRASLMSQLALFLSLQEDLQCRFSLARTRLEAMLVAIGSTQFVSSHVQYHLKRSTTGKISEEDAQIVQAYNECLQLQLQLNLAQQAIKRLRTSLSLDVDTINDGVNTDVLLEQTLTDKLRVILESVLDTLLTCTVGSPAIPQPPAALYSAFTLHSAQELFRRLCIQSPQRVQVSAGLLLVRACGAQPWWGNFLGSVLQDFFSGNLNQVFPQDRVFVLLTGMGQKSLNGPSALLTFNNLLAMLSSILEPLTRNNEDGLADHRGNLDLSLISWVLLFLCRNMEGSSSLSASSTDESEKNSKKDKEGAMCSNRWGFIESQWTPTSGGIRGKYQRIYRRGALKKKHLWKKNQLLMKLTGETAKVESVNEVKDVDLDVEPMIILPRERCLSVAQGLMALLLSMDFTCHVDLFLVTCKVLAKMCVACRPSLALCEVMTQDQLEKLMLLVVDTQFNHETMTWGGPWAAHAITCLLQDILEGKHSSSTSSEGSETELSDGDDALVYSRWMQREGSMLCTEQVHQNKKVRVIPFEHVRTILRNKPEFHDFVKRDFMNGSLCLETSDDPAALVSLFLNKSDKDKLKWNKFIETVTKNQTQSSSQMSGVTADCPIELRSMIMDYVNGQTSVDPLASLMNDAINSGNYVDAVKIAQSNQLYLQRVAQSGGLKQLPSLKNKLTEHMASSSGISLHLSTALDARLEFGLETTPEHRLKMMHSVQLGNIRCAFTSAVPTVPPGSLQEETTSSLPVDEDLRGADTEQNPTSSMSMLSTCFEHMFARLRSGRVGLESVLQLWLTLNEDHAQGEDGTSNASSSAASRGQVFDPTRQPSIVLSESAVASLMEVGVMMPSLSVRTWVYLLQALCLLANQRHTSQSGVETSLAPAVLRDQNLAELITKFLCSHPPGGSGPAGSHHYQVGPAAVKILSDLLHRLQCKSIEVNGQRFREMLLKIVYNLIADRGAIYQCSGPIDAQVQFLEMISESPMMSVDVSNALSVIQAASTLVYQHLAYNEQVMCHTSHDTSHGANSCFGGLVASLLRGTDNRPGGSDQLRDQLMFYLLQLVNKLISVPMCSMTRMSGSASNVDNAPASEASGQAHLDGSRLTPKLVTTTHLSDDEKFRTRSGTDSPLQLGAGQQNTEADARLDDTSEESSPRTVSEIADIVVGHPVIMQNLIQSLSHCSSNKLALMFAHTDCLTRLQKSVDQTEPVTVGDLIFTVLRSLREKCSDRTAMVDNLYQYFTGIRSSFISEHALTRLSEPLLFYTLRILNSHIAIKKFIELGGVSVVSNNLVRCSQQMVSSSPSIISTLMQSFNSSNTDLVDKNKGLEVDNTDGLQSFAQLGTIMCSSPTAVPADGLIQPLANRRARSATWSYHFYPDEPCVELTIHLPHAVLLKYVHIRPHAAAISTCPSHVSLELSHDGNVVTPASRPLLTSSLTLIRLQLQRPEVVTSVTLLLHRPLDSTTIGLQRISLWGQTAFVESSDGSLPNSEDGFSRSSLGWMRVLHHCLLHSGTYGTNHLDLQNQVARMAASTPGLLAACTSLLLHPTLGAHAAKMETILIRLGLSSPAVGLDLIDNILRQTTANGSAPAMFFLGKMHGVASPHTVEIIYRLGTTQDDNTQDRVAALLRWVEDCANAALTLQTEATSMFGLRLGNRTQRTLSNPSPEHIQCVAAVLWYSMELDVTYPLHRLISVELIRLLFDWSRLLDDGNLRKSLNNLLCSACHICQNGFMHVQEWMGIVRSDGSQIVAPSEGLTQQREVMTPGRMTDDSKEATRHPTRQQDSTDGMTDDSKEARRLQSFSSMNLDESKLMLLAGVCKSPAATHQLMSCGLPAMLAQAVCEFCSQQMRLISCFRQSCDVGETSESSITASVVSSILRFFTEISSELQLKNWLGQAEGNAFWSLLLTVLCGSKYQTPVIRNSSSFDSGLMTAEERSEIETRTIHFFSTVISFHAENQLLFAKVLCDVIKDQGTSKADLASAMPLSGFMRRLLLQVLLEDEKVTVAVRNSSNVVSTDDDTLNEEGSEVFPLASCSGQIFHPRYGSGRGCQCVVMNLNAKCSDVVSKVADTLPLSNSSADKKDEKKKRTDEAAAKEKREKTQAAGTSTSTASSASSSGLIPRPPTRRGRLTQGSDSLLEASGSLRMPQALFRARLRHVALPGKDLPHNLTLSQLLHVLSEYALLPQTLALQFVVRFWTPGSTPFKDGINEGIASDLTLLSAAPFPSALKMFANVGGLALLAEHLPLLFPEISRQSNNVEVVSDGTSVCDIGADWVTVESSDEIYDPYIEPITPPSVSKTNKTSSNGSVPSIPPHSLIAFGLFLRLPGYADVLLKERRTAQFLLRLVLGVTDDGDGGQILTSPAANSLPTLPFMVLKTLFDSSPLTTDDGVLLRRMALDIGVVHLVLACLATLSHHKPRRPLTSLQHETQLILTAMQSSAAMASLSQPEEKSQQHYWAKGTGFGTGSTTSSWDAEQALLRQKGEEEHVACLLQVLASYTNPNSSFEANKKLTTTFKMKTSAVSVGAVSSDAVHKPSSGEGEASRTPPFLTASDSDSSPSPPYSPSDGDVAGSTTHTNNHNIISSSLVELLSQSCLVPALSSYLRNDSVLDMARHVPLYQALLQLLRGITSSLALVPILLPSESGSKDEADDGTAESQASIEVLLEKMKGCVDTYASRLKSNRGKSGNKIEDEKSEGLALLIPDIQETARLVRQATQRHKEMNEKNEKAKGGQTNANQSTPKPEKTVEHKYLAAMKELQFDTYEMVTEEGKMFKFHLSHHYESNVKATGSVSNIARTRRLAQEAVTLSTSLPLAFSSSVFVRCDEERLDVMKVLITGPSDTPYANGCFEFDVFFPHDYPNTPPFINMETTGNHSVRFNPNLYNDGKVCLSILNTWHGRPEEKWNAQTSSFLQVLVSIQSLILVSEPYFNEPGYERSRGTPPGQASSHEYDANIRQATVKWAMLEQLRNPSPCFKEIIHTHFWLKREEILQQCENWIAEMEGFSSDKRTGRSIAQSNLALKRHYSQLKDELAKLKPPADLQEDEVKNENNSYGASSSPQSGDHMTDIPLLPPDLVTTLPSNHNSILFVDEGHSLNSLLTMGNEELMPPPLTPADIYFDDDPEC